MCVHINYPTNERVTSDYKFFMIKTYFKYWTQRVFFRHVFLIARSNRTNGNQILLGAILYRTIFINFISHIKDCEGLVLIDVNTSAQVWSVKKGLFFVTFLVTPITSQIFNRQSPTTVICKLLTEVIPTARSFTFIRFKQKLFQRSFSGFHFVDFRPSGNRLLLCLK